MKKITTCTQKRILENYWRNHAPFTVSSLIEKKILHFSSFGKLTLRLMESRGQIKKHYPWEGEVIYVATTESQMEWEAIWRQKRLFSGACCGPSQTVLSMNRYERQELCEELEKMITDFKLEDNAPESYQYDMI